MPSIALSRIPLPSFVIHRAKPKTQRHRHPHTARNGNRLEWANPGRLSARLASIHFCLSVNNMASCVCVVVLTTAPPSALPPPAVAMRLCGALRLALRCIGSFQFTPRVPAPARKVERAPRQTEAGMGGGSSRVRNVPFGQNSFGICGIDSTVAQVQSPLPQSISKERKAPRLAWRQPSCPARSSMEATGSRCPAGMSFEKGFECCSLARSDNLTIEYLRCS